jgi:hypothetical protein
MNRLPLSIIRLLAISTFVSSADETKREFKPVTLMKPLPAIVDTQIQAGEDLEGRINNSELVLGVTVNGSARAYPINMLTGPRREIINDKLGGKAIAATW